MKTFNGWGWSHGSSMIIVNYDSYMCNLFYTVYRRQNFPIKVSFPSLTGKGCYYWWRYSVLGQNHKSEALRNQKTKQKDLQLILPSFLSMQTAFSLIDGCVPAEKTPPFCWHLMPDRQVKRLKTAQHCLCCAVNPLNSKFLEKWSIVQP